MTVSSFWNHPHCQESKYIFVWNLRISVFWLFSHVFDFILFQNCIVSEHVYLYHSWKKESWIRAMRMISKTYDGRQLPSKATYSFEIILIAFYCFKRGFDNFQKVSRFSDFGEIFFQILRVYEISHTGAVCCQSILFIGRSST